MAQVILITGASSGLGKAAAGYLASLGHIVYGTSRNPFREPVPFHGIIMDVTQESSVRSAVDSILRTEGRLDVLINNAGFGIGGALENFSDEEARNQMNTNFFGAVNVIRCVLPHMRMQSGGKIINISSIGGLMGLPFQGHYSATKFALEGFSEALAMEVKPYHIRVVLVNPGDFRTGFTANRQLTERDQAGNPYEKRFRKALEVIEKDEQGGSDPVLLATTLARIVRNRNPRFHYVVGRLDQRIMAAIKPLLPAKVREWILMGHYGV